MTLFDFITEIKGVEYLIAVPAIGLFLVLIVLFARGGIMGGVEKIYNSLKRKEPA